MIALNANAQFAISYSLGYDSYKMDDMKELLDNMAKEISYQLSGIPVVVVDDFPGYITHNLSLSYRIKRHEMGLNGTFLTTAGKIAYSDYTGEYSGKLILNGFRVGINYRFYIPIIDFNKNSSLSLYTEISPGITFSKLKSKEYIRIFDQSENANTNLNLKANGISLLPQVGIKWLVTRHIGIQIGGGYNLQLGSHLKYNGTKSNITADWSGFRVNGGLSFSW